MESLVDVSTSSYKKSLEYLFYGIDPNAPNEIHHVIEEGFRYFFLLLIFYIFCILYIYIDHNLKINKWIYAHIHL